MASKGYKLCPECGQPVLKKGQKRKHPDDYRHARGCPNADAKEIAEPSSFIICTAKGVIRYPP